jgi:hypothetical protein
MLKTLKVAIHGLGDYLSHFYYASLEPPTSKMEARSADKIAQVYKWMKKLKKVSSNPTKRHKTYMGVKTGLNSLDNDPQCVAGVYVRA